MKNIRKHFHVILLALGLFVTMACEDLAFGDKFLQKPPSTDVTIDTVFSTAEYAVAYCRIAINICLMVWKPVAIILPCGWELLKDSPT